MFLAVTSAGHMEWYVYLAVIGVGTIAGFINTLAGSGSLLTLPLLMFLGLPANIANGTNRVAILLQNVVGASSFRQQKILSFRQGLALGIPAAAGAIAGAQIAVNFNEVLMRRTIGGLLIIMFFLIIFKPDAWVKDRAGEVKSKQGILNAIIFFLIGIYGGFIQAGVGFFLLAGLVLSVGADLVKANALKVFIVMLYTIPALAVFLFHNQVNLKIGLILAVGNMTGAFIGSKVAISWGPKFVRYILLLAILFSSLKLLGFFDLIFGK